jgi:hypothetical protein
MKLTEVKYKVLIKRNVLTLLEKDEYLIVPKYKIDAMDCSECRGISLASLAHTILSSIFHTSLTPYIVTTTRNGAELEGVNKLKR